MIKRASRKIIPRGCCTTYIPCLSLKGNNYSKHTMMHTQKIHSQRKLCPSAVAVAGTNRKHRLKKQQEESLENIKDALGTDKTRTKSHYNVTANQIAHQLILNGKRPGSSLKRQKIQRLPKKPKQTSQAHPLHLPKLKKPSK
jgi:hypothetical protein